ncbi:MAG TPA: hypothetical protein VFX89_06370, partial [Gammaproteobacteria bacterium]|nr:hypothetical protein [Gammaproteobacteria bacterium]
LLYPELDLWKTAQPVLEDWLKQRRDPRTQLKALVAAWPDISEDLAMLPRLLHRAVRRADMDELAAQRARRVTVVRGPSLINTAGGVQRAVAAGALLIAGALWTGLAEPHWIGWLGVLAGLVLLVPRRGD